MNSTLYALAQFCACIRRMLPGFTVRTPFAVVRLLIAGVALCILFGSSRLVGMRACAATCLPFTRLPAYAAAFCAASLPCACLSRSLQRAPFFRLVNRGGGRAYGHGNAQLLRWRLRLFILMSGISTGYRGSTCLGRRLFI